MAAIEIIAQAMRRLGKLQSGEVPSDEEAEDALIALNQMLDAWTAERLMIYTFDIAEFPLVVGQQSYQYGAGAAAGNFNATRPSKISRASIMVLSNPAQPLELPLDYNTAESVWQAIRVKATSSSIPQVLYDDGGFPFRTIYLWPIPSVAANIRFYGTHNLSQFPDLTTRFSFPPAYLKAISWNLCLELAPEYEVEPSATMAAQAIGSKGVIKRANVPDVFMSVDPGVSGNRRNESFNVLTGE